MRTLYHFQLSPFSRAIRVMLVEKALPFELEVEKVWDRRSEFLSMNPACEVPVLIELDGAIFADSRVISEYLDEAYPERSLIGGDSNSRAEARRLTQWFDVKFNAEVTDNLVGEKLMKRLSGQGYPQATAIRTGLTEIHNHLAYISFLAERRRWLAGDHFSAADIVAAAHLSVVDYIGDVPWEDHPGAKDWFVRIKSRPSFRPLLADRVPGVQPPAHYADLDF
ncbi:MAG: glutathione S-transferase [Rhodospirillales bacterium]|nr:glutathione S-transferase [Rhodospirillales bacterium]